MAAWIDRLLAKLDHLRTVDMAFLTHGADTHWYRFGPRIPLPWLSWLEAKYQVELPGQYRQFLLEAGNGGAGPHYGLQRFGYLDSPRQAPVSCGTGVIIYTEYAVDFRRGQEKRYLPDGTPTDGFETSFYEGMRMLGGGNPILARPFPFTDRRYSNDKVFDALKGYPVGTPEEPRWAVPGALYLTEYGCGATQMLVLNGRWAGSVWMQDLANDGGYQVEAETFEEWYDAWLDRSLHFCTRSLNYRRLRSMFATGNPAEARDLEVLLRARAIGCEVEEGRTTVVLVNTDQCEEARPLIDAFAARRRE